MKCNAALGLAAVAFLGYLCPSGITVLAESSTESSPSAKSLTRLLEDHYRLPHTFQAAFLERFSEGPRQARIESGTVYFRRPGQMRWEYESPEKKLFLVDGRNTWFYVPYDHTVTKIPVKESSDLRTPLALITRRTELSHLCSRIDIVAQPGIANGNSVLRCLPKGADPAGNSPAGHPAPTGYGLGESQEYSDVLLEVNATSGELARIEIRQPGGIELEYRFGNWQTDIPLSDSLFHFQVPPGVAIVDGTTPPQDSN